MSGNRVISACLLAALLLPTAATAQRRGQPERKAPEGNVVVRDPIVGQPPRVPPVPSQPIAVKPVRVRPVVVVPPVVSAPRAVERRGAMRPTAPSMRPGTSPARPVRRGPRGHRPYYVFSPRGSIGYGLLVGFPVAYPYASPYVDPYISTSYSSYRAAAPARTTYSNVDSVAPGPSTGRFVECGSADACGGVSFDVTPATAQVSVDGVFVGAVDEFGASSVPLVLAPGDHYVEIRLPGYRTASFDVTIAPGEVTPYQGALDVLRTR